MSGSMEQECCLFFCSQHLEHLTDQAVGSFRAMQGRRPHTYLGNWARNRCRQQWCHLPWPRTARHTASHLMQMRWEGSWWPLVAELRPFGSSGNPVLLAHCHCQVHSLAPQVGFRGQPIRLAALSQLAAPAAAAGVAGADRRASTVGSRLVLGWRHPGPCSATRAAGSGHTDRIQGST